MPLSKDTITAVEPLANLTEDQIAALVTLSSNLEQKAIDETTNRIHSEYDKDVERLTGRRKPGDAKSYHHLQEVLTDLIEKANTAGNASTLQTQVETLRREKDAVEAKIKDGVTDTAARQRIADLERQIADKDGEIKSVKTTLEQEKTTLQKRIDEMTTRSTLLEMENEWSQFATTNGIKFKNTIPETVVKDILATRKNLLLSVVKRDFVDDGKGGKIPVLRDERGEIIRNPARSHEPFTFGELLMTKIEDLIDKPATGGGTKPAGGGGGIPLNIAAARNQIDADEMIVEHILRNEGIAKTNPQFAIRQGEIRKELKVSELPVR